MRPPDGDPGALAWLTALVSLALPWLGLGLGLYGAWLIGRSQDTGWLLIGAAILTFVLDILIDFVWAHPSVSKSDQPDLNRRGKQYVGLVVVVEEAIEAGRGKVRVGDTLWQAEGPDLPKGARVRVVGVNGVVLVVGPVAEPTAA